MAACLNNVRNMLERKKWGTVTINTTVNVDVNIYSPQIGQSHSVDRSMHLCEFSSAIDIHTLHLCEAVLEICRADEDLIN